MRWRPHQIGAVVEGPIKLIISGERLALEVTAKVQSRKGIPTVDTVDVAGKRFPMKVQIQLVVSRTSTTIANAGEGE